MTSAGLWRIDWMPADPLVSLVIGGLILWSSMGLLRRTLAILIHATPAHLDFREILAALEGNEHVAAVHDMHIVALSRARRP